MANKKMLLFSLLQSKQANYRIFGMSRKATQLCDTLTSSQTVNGITFTNNGDGSWTINGTATADARKQIKSMVGTKGKTLFIKGAPIGSSFDTYFMCNDNLVTASRVDIGYGSIFTWSYDFTWSFDIRVKQGTTVNNVKFYPQVFDLTQDLGAGNEPTTVEQALEYYPKPYMAYTGQKGTIINAGGECVASGRQLWNEQTKKGYYDGSNGNYVYNENQLCSDGDIKVKPNTTYYSNLSTLGTTWRIVYLNANKEFISSTAMSSNTFTTPSNCEYIRFGLGSLYGATYNNNVLFQESSYTDTTYTQYISPKHFTLPPLRGIGDLKDSIETATGNTERKFSEVDLGTYNFGTDSTSRFILNINNLPKAPKTGGTSDIPNIICSKYTSDTPYNVSHSVNDKTITIHSNGYVYVYDTDYTSATDFKTAMSGVKLVYELATYTTEQNPSFGLGKGITRIVDQNGYELEFEEIEIV